MLKPHGHHNRSWLHVPHEPHPEQAGWGGGVPRPVQAVLFLLLPLFSPAAVRHPPVRHVCTRGVSAAPHVHHYCLWRTDHSENGHVSLTL